MTGGGTFETDRRPVDQLVPFARNARTHSDAQVAQLAASIREFGFTIPVLIDETGGIIAGHGRVLAAKQLGLPDVPVIIARGWTDAQKRAYVIADNKLALNAGWNNELLRLELSELKEFSFDLALTGFSSSELRGLFAGGGNADPEATPEPPADPVTRPGDIWLMGDHRLICGDATDPASVARLFGSARPKLMVTDPPYGVSYDPRWRLEAGVNKIHQTRAEGKVTNDARSDWREAWALFPGEVAYVWHGGLHAAVVAQSIESQGFNIRSQIIWAKPSLVIGRGNYHWQHEPCWYAVREGATANWLGGHKQSTIWQIQNMHATQGNVDDGKTNHSTQKPVECMRRPIESHTIPGELVYDPFLGSGTTLIAAQMTGRICLGSEIDPAYCDVIVKRWENFTNQKATLDARPQTDTNGAAPAARESEQDRAAEGGREQGGPSEGSTGLAKRKAKGKLGLRNRPRPARAPAAN